MRGMRGCPATRRMFHQFDPVTHRCKCGRWQAGFKPKVEPTRPRAECQICERTQACEVNGCLGHHGYKRPGMGWIEGDCMGVDHLPYPATDALEKYLGVLIAYIGRTQEALERAPALTELPFHWTEYVDRKKVERTTMIVKGEPLPRCGQYCVTPFESLLKRHMLRLENEIRHATDEKTRVEARIAKAKTP